LTRAVLDHVAIGAWSADEVAAGFSRRLGGREVARFSIPSWAGVQLSFAGGIRLEVLEPVENPADDFLQRFLERSGPSPHHATFKVDDIRAALERLKGLGIKPVKVDLSDPSWQEAFLHPSLGLGTVVQLAQQGGPWSAEKKPAPEPEGSVRAEFLGAELASDLESARTIFGDVLGGTPGQVGDGIAYSWPGAGTLLLRPAGDARPGVRALVFRCAATGGHAQPGDEQLYGGPAQVRLLAPGADWPPPDRLSA
jgi:catechol 2,3-dioxygenase-like lactoylglutathione lyase family enzyme